jgi:WD40 repeat protein
VAVTPDGTRAISGADDETLKVWDLDSGEVLMTFWADAPVWACAVTPDGVTIVAGDQLGHVHFLRTEQGERQEGR